MTFDHFELETGTQVALVLRNFYTNFGFSTSVVLVLWAGIEQTDRRIDRQTDRQCGLWGRKHDKSQLWWWLGTVERSVLHVSLQLKLFAKSFIAFLLWRMLWLVSSWAGWAVARQSASGSSDTGWAEAEKVAALWCSCLANVIATCVQLRQPQAKEWLVASVPYPG